jgi:hypothetical protein
MCREYSSSIELCKGRDIGQAFSHRLPTAAARVRARANLCGMCGGQSGTGFRFSPSMSGFTTNSHSTFIILSSAAGTLGQLVADVPSRLSLTPPQENKKIALFKARVLSKRGNIKSWISTEESKIVLLVSRSVAHTLSPRNEMCKDYCPHGGRTAK